MSFQTVIPIDFFLFLSRYLVLIVLVTQLILYLVLIFFQALLHCSRSSLAKEFGYVGIRGMCWGWSHLYIDEFCSLLRKRSTQTNQNIYFKYFLAGSSPTFQVYSAETSQLRVTLTVRSNYITHLTQLIW